MGWWHISQRTPIRPRTIIHQERGGGGQEIYRERSKELDFVPNPDIVVSGAREIETMEVDRLNKGKFKA